MKHWRLISLALFGGFWPPELRRHILRDAGRREASQKRLGGPPELPCAPLKILTGDRLIFSSISLDCYLLGGVLPKGGHRHLNI
jgi:hypothetical protein